MQNTHRFLTSNKRPVVVFFRLGDENAKQIRNLLILDLY